MLERYKELAVLCGPSTSESGQDGSFPSAADRLTVEPSMCSEAKMWVYGHGRAGSEQQQILRPYAAAWQQLLQPFSPFSSWKQGDLVQQT